MTDTAPRTALHGSGPDDETLERIWLHGRPATTRRCYALELGKLRRSLGVKSLRAAELGDLQAHVDTLRHLAPRTQARAIAAIKSFFDFHQRVGTLQANPSAALSAPAVPDDLAERILGADDVQALIAAGAGARDRLILKLLYVAGLRASELCGLHRRNLAARSNGEGQVTVFGKGGKTRAVLLPAELFAELQAFASSNGQKATDPVFPSVTDASKCIGQRSLLALIKRAAKAAGLSDKVSTHWLRHAHASHSLDAGAPITLVRDTLGHASIATTNKYAHARPNDGSARFLRTG